MKNNTDIIYLNNWQADRRTTALHNTIFAHEILTLNKY